MKQIKLATESSDSEDLINLKHLGPSTTQDHVDTS